MSRGEAVAGGHGRRGLSWRRAGVVSSGRGTIWLRPARCRTEDPMMAEEVRASLRMPSPTNAPSGTLSRKGGRADRAVNT